MKTLYPSKIKWKRLFITLLVMAIPFVSYSQITSYNDCAAATAGTIVTIQNGNELNQSFNVLGASNTNSTTDPSCVAPSVGQRDSWVGFDATATGTVIFEYTPTSGQNAALVVYVSNTGCGGLALMRCASVQAANVTETITLNVINTNRYYVRVINLTNTNDMNGVLSIYNGPKVLGDLCQNAQEVSIGTCDFRFNVDASFFNNEGKVNPACAATLQKDGWLKFEATAGQRVGIEYTSTGISLSSLDAAIAVYDGNCGTPVERACANNAGGGEKEFFEYNVVTTGTQYIRIMNVENGETLTGSICIYEVFTRNNCADLSVVTPLNLGDCGIRMNILSGYTNSGTNTNSCITNNIDAWIPFTSNITTNVLFEYTSVSGQPIDIAIYETPLTCGANPTALECTANTIGNTTLEFAATAGTTYYIQIVSRNNVEAFGTICLYNTDKKSEDNFFTSNSFLLDNSDCGKQFNILSTFNSTGGASIGNPSVISCSGNPVRADAWASFTTPGVLPVGYELSIEYDNDNQEASDASDAAIIIYRGSTINAPENAAALPAGSIETTSAVTQDINLDTFYENISMPAFTFPLPFPEIWARVNVTTPGVHSFVFDVASDVEIFVYAQADLVTPLAVLHSNTIRPEQLAVNLPAAGRYYFQIQNVDIAFTNGKLGIFSPLTQVGCANSVLEGVERVTLSSLAANTTYFVRVVNIDANVDILNPSSLSTIAGKLCIRDGNVPADDICSTARPLVVGDCNISFSLTDANLPVLQPGAGTVYPDASCLVAKTIRTEAWARFTAIGTKTTIEYANLSNGGQDAAIAIYKGSCGGLTPILNGCANYFEDFIGPTQGLESISVNTIVNETYYIQIMNLGSTGNMDGRLCIFNTTERDVCDDDDLINLIADVCNLKMNVPSSFTNSGADYAGNTPNTAGDPSTWDRNSCGAVDIDYGILYPGTRDSWVRYVGNGNLITIQYENQNDAADPSNPMLLLYTAIQGPGPVDCGTGINGAGNTGNQLACANDIVTVGQQTESLTFQSVSGQLYILRVLDLSPGDMKGTICIFSGQKAPAIVCSATAIDIKTIIGEDLDIGKCNVQFNVTTDNADCGLAPARCSDAVSSIYINAGGPTVTLNGQTWLADDIYSPGGNTYTNNGCTMNDTADPGNATMYRSERYGGTITYNIPVTAGQDYTVNLHFAEIYWTANNQRVLRANIEGGAFELENYDAHFVTGGRCIANVQTFTVTENGNGMLNIVIQRQPSAGSDGNAKISGISITPVTPPSTSCESVAWATFTTGAGASAARFPLPGNNMTVQYDNSTNSSIDATDVSLEIYRATPDCNTLTFIGCADQFTNSNAEGIEEVNFPVNDAASETYYIRVINKSVTKTAFGKLCIFYGETIARPTCAETLNYGDVNGVWKSFKVLSNWNNTAPQNTITAPTPCAVAGGSSPVAPNPPIISNGWVRFEVPPTSDLEAVTVQFDNAAFASTSSNSENAALAVYVGPAASTFTYPLTGSECSLSSLTLITCVNNVWRGTESLTIGVVPGGTYYVRIMNVKNIGKDMPGRIRIFEFVSCQLGGELVIDGDFSGWGPITFPATPTLSKNPNDASVAGAINSWYDMNPWEYSNNNPNIEDYRRNLATADLTRHINSYSRFATDYGYLIDNTAGANGSYRANSFDRLRASTGEFNPEGRYAVSQQAFTRKGGGFDQWDFYGYGNGYTGYGGHSYDNYCSSGPATPYREEPCTDFGTYQSNLPTIVPYTADANFMSVNGWWKTDGGIDPGKVWCQTINASSTAGATRYYVFTAWFQNLIGAGRNLDVPQLRITICDMTNPASPEVVNSAGIVTAGALPSPQFNAAFSSALPGVTFTPTTNNPNDLTYHFPEPPNNGDVKKASPMGFDFGAAEPCNLTTEPKNARIKILGSDFLVPESPDQWLVVRCIYRAPAAVNHFNVCIENLSLTKNGNDFAIDDISMRQCNTTNTEALDDLLRGDACELADDPTALGIPLSARILDFSGTLLGERVALSWITIIEQNLSYYEIQRSVDGVEFSPIGSVDAKGAEQELATYQFVDNQLPEGKRYLYYRLRMIDRNGYPEFSDVIRINIESLSKLDINLYPNPVGSNQEVNLDFEAQAGKAQLLIADIAGNPLKRQYIDTVEGKNKVVLSTQGLAPGIYIIKLNLGYRQTSKKLVISY